MSGAATLARGDLEVLGILPRSSNHTFLVRVTSEGHEGHEAPEAPDEPAASDADPDAQPTLAVYKPQAGERPLWDFPDGSLCAREVAASVLADALGWPRVPATILRDGPFGPGSVQAFVAFDPEHHFFTLRDDAVDEMRRIALFDVVANNADRKGGHILRALDGGIFVVDHGLCFHVEPKLRTVVWEHAGEDVPPPLLDDLRRVSGELDGGLGARLAELLEDDEVDALRQRIASILAERRFPLPSDDHPVPWPLV